LTALTLKITITVKPNSKKNEVLKSPDGSLVVFVNAPPVEGKANQKVIDLLSDFFNKPKRCISIISGHKGKHKLVEIA
jgi:uncharacterized protein